MKVNEWINQTEESELLEEYQPGDFFMETPVRTVLGKGKSLSVMDAGSIDENLDLAGRAAKALREAQTLGHAAPIVAGAVPFDVNRPACLFVPETVLTSPSRQGTERNLKGSVKPAMYEITPVPSAAEYQEGVKKALALIQRGDLDKIVLSRSLHLQSSEAVDIRLLLQKLARGNQRGYTYAADLSDGLTASIKTLIGASPELLVSKEGRKVTANPLAGSRPRSQDPDEDRRRALELLDSEKDLHEHALVVKAAAASLRPFLKRMGVPEKPSIVSTETMWHLSTIITGELKDEKRTSLEIALALHPTPAVCGTPAIKARQAIAEIEPFDRGFFTGMAGWCDAEGDGEWIVAIRCAEAEGRDLRLYAGAGIVRESVPQEELAETAAKFQTMLRAMGVDAKQMEGLTC